jgi:hypothetical protein
MCSVYGRERKNGPNSTIVTRDTLDVSVTWATARRKETSDASAVRLRNGYCTAIGQCSRISVPPVQLGFRFQSLPTPVFASRLWRQMTCSHRHLVSGLAITLNYA